MSFTSIVSWTFCFEFLQTALTERTSSNADDVEAVLDDIKFKLYQHWASTRTAFLNFVGQFAKKTIRLTADVSASRQDKDRNGTVSPEEFSKQLKNLGFSDDMGTDIEGLLQEFDADKSGAISYNEFFSTVEGSMLPIFTQHKMEAKTAKIVNQGSAEAEEKPSVRFLASSCILLCDLLTKYGPLEIHLVQSYPQRRN